MWEEDVLSAQTRRSERTHRGNCFNFFKREESERGRERGRYGSTPTLWLGGSRESGEAWEHHRTPAVRRYLRAAPGNARSLENTRENSKPGKWDFYRLLLWWHFVSKGSSVFSEIQPKGFAHVHTVSGHFLYISCVCGFFFFAFSLTVYTQGHDTLHNPLQY